MISAALISVAIPKETPGTQAFVPAKTDAPTTLISQQALDAASEGDHFLAAAMAGGKSRSPYLVDAE